MIILGIIKLSLNYKADLTIGDVRGLDDVPNSTVVEMVALFHKITYKCDLMN